MSERNGSGNVLAKIGVPVLVILIATAIVSGVTAAFASSENCRRIEVVEDRQRVYDADVTSMKMDLREIKVLLKRIEKE